MTKTAASRPFDFGTEFAPDGEVLRSKTVKRVFSPEDLEQAREEGRQEGRQSAEAEAAEAAAAALKTLAGQMQMALSQVGNLHESLRAEAAELTLAASRKIAGSALEARPEAEMAELVEICAAELRAAPRLIARLPEPLMERLEPQLEQALEGIGFSGMLRVEAIADGAPGAVSLDWEEGAVSFDPAETCARIETLLRARLSPARHGETNQNERNEDPAIEAGEDAS